MKDRQTDEILEGAPVEPAEAEAVSVTGGNRKEEKIRRNDSSFCAVAFIRNSRDYILQVSSVLSNTLFPKHMDERYRLQQSGSGCCDGAFGSGD